jgi:hypothetical protein
VLSGRVAVTPSSGGTVASIAAGEHGMFDEHGGRLAETNGAPPANAPAGSTEKRPAPIAAPTDAAAAPSTTFAPLPSGGDHWSAARNALDRGDRASAESELRALLASSADEALSRRAAFMLAELELARGASASGRLRLDELLRSGDRERSRRPAPRRGKEHCEPSLRGSQPRGRLPSEPRSPLVWDV